MRSKRSAFWHYPLAFLVGMAWALIPTYFGLSLLDKPATLVTVASVSFFMTLAVVAVIEVFYWRSIHQNRILALEALDTARAWAAEGSILVVDEVRTQLMIDEVRMQLAKGVQNQNILHLKHLGPEMLERFHHLDGQRAHPEGTPVMFIEQLAMAPWIPVILPFVIVHGFFAAP